MSVLNELGKKDWLYLWKSKYFLVVTIQWRSMANTHCVKWVVKVNITSYVIWTLCTPWYDVMRSALHFCGIFFYKFITKPSQNTRKTLAKHKLRVVLQNTWPVLFKTIKVMENKERLRSCRRPEETKEIWQMNVMWYSWVGSWNR